MSEGGHPVAKVGSFAKKTLAKKAVAKKAVAKKPVAKKAVAKKPVAQVGSRRVVINGRDLELPEGWELEDALREVMVEVPCTDLEQISIPSTALEVHLKVAPRVFAMNCWGYPLAVAYVDGELLWRGSGAFYTAWFPSKDVLTLCQGELFFFAARAPTSACCSVAQIITLNMRLCD